VNGVADFLVSGSHFNVGRKIFIAAQKEVQILSKFKAQIFVYLPTIICSFIGKIRFLRAVIRKMALGVRDHDD